jgi:hypothetical protein
MRKAVDLAAKGLVDAELGSGLIKQRLSRQGQGRSGLASYGLRASNALIESELKAGRLIEVKHDT